MTDDSETWMIDFEGTLTDNLWRQHLITGPDKDWVMYFKGLLEDQPVTPIVDLAINLPLIGARVIIYTTRMPNKYNMEVEWLKKNNIQIREGMKFLIRQNTKLPGPQLLRQWCEEYRPTHVVDDRPDNRNAIRDIVPNVYDPQELMTGAHPNTITPREDND